MHEVFKGLDMIRLSHLGLVNEIFKAWWSDAGLVHGERGKVLKRNGKLPISPNPIDYHIYWSTKRIVSCSMNMMS